MDFTTFGALCRLYEHNMKVLHWGCFGPKFDRAHKLCDQYADLIHEQVDWAGETGLRIGQNPPSFDQILSILKNADHDYVVCQYKMIEYAEVTKYIEKMLHDIMEALVELHELDIMEEPTNMGIKSTIESIYDKFDFEVRYLNKRRMMPSEEKGHGGGCSGGHGMGDHHDDDDD